MTFESSGPSAVRRVENGPQGIPFDRIIQIARARKTTIQDAENHGPHSSRSNVAVREKKTKPPARHARAPTPNQWPVSSAADVEGRVSRRPGKMRKRSGCDERSKQREDTPTRKARPHGQALQ